MAASTRAELDAENQDEVRGEPHPFFSSLQMSLFVYAASISPKLFRSAILHLSSSNHYDCEITKQICRCDQSFRYTLLGGSWDWLLGPRRLS